MNKKREPYDKIAVGERIRRKRIQLGLSQDELASGSTVQQNTVRILNAGCVACPLKRCWQLPKH